MNFITRNKSLIIFYVVVAALTYALTMRVEKLERNNNEPSGVVVNLW